MTVGPEAGLPEFADVLDTGCVILDGTMTVQAWNRWMESASGLSIADVVGRKITDVLRLDDDSIAVRSIRRAMRGEAVVLSHQFHEYVFPFDPPPGYSNVENMQQSARVLPHVVNGAAGAIVLVEDVTERIARERELSDARDAAESASKAKSEFLAAISHELRTPLTAILGYADLLQSEIGGTLNTLQHEHMERITAGTWHLIKIIEEILSFSRVEANKYEVTVEPVNATDIINQTVALLQQQAAMKGVTLDVQSSEASLIVETDPLKLRQILLNLLGNAIKFTDSGSVTVETRRKAQQLQVRVIDTGSGVPARMQRLIFEPFVQADQSATRAKGGTGLGLALSRSLAELLGGELVLESSSPSGSVFRLLLPIHWIGQVQGTRTLAM